jgi:hypothetical protein
MTLKRKRVLLGKKIRKATGLLLPIAMRMGKLILRGTGYEIRNLYPSLVKLNMFPCGVECCGSNGYKIVGPRGEFGFY